MNNRPRVSVAVIIIKQNKVLIGKRKRVGTGKGMWGFPGGHLEFYETFEDCAIREVMEETGLKIQNIQFGAITNDHFEKDRKHYITLFFTADYISGVPKVLEPEKSERWEWFSWNNLPSPLFLPIKNLLKQQYDPF